MGRASQSKQKSTKAAQVSKVIREELRSNELASQGTSVKSSPEAVNEASKLQQQRKQEKQQQQQLKAAGILSSTPVSSSSTQRLVQTPSSILKATPTLGDLLDAIDSPNLLSADIDLEELFQDGHEAVQQQEEQKSK